MKAPTLEEQLLAASKELRAKHSDLQARRNAVGAQLSALVNAPPNRADLRCFFERFLTDLLRREPRAPLHELRTSLERFAKNPARRKSMLFWKDCTLPHAAAMVNSPTRYFWRCWSRCFLSKPSGWRMSYPGPIRPACPPRRAPSKLACSKGKWPSCKMKSRICKPPRNVCISLSPDVEPAKTA